MILRRSGWFTGSLVAMSVVGISGYRSGISDEPPRQVPEAKTVVDAALERTQEQIKMLDDIYKGGIVIITENYVNEETEIPAGTAFKQLFEAAEKKGWHQVRLLDATGEPYDDVNSPRDDFEKKAVKALVAGETWYESVETREGIRHLRVATAIPVVFKKCVMCHDNYADVPPGKAIGALSFTVPIDGKLVIKPVKQ